MIQSGSLNRRQALRLLGGAALAAVPALGVAREAAAGRTWCRVDPLFLIGDYLFDVTIGADIAMLTAANGPIDIVIETPVNMPASLVFQDGGFGYGYTYSFVQNKKLRANNNTFTLRVKVVAPATDDAIPVTVYLTSLSGKAVISQIEVGGYANETVTWAGKVDAVTLLDIVNGK